ncbi:MAG: hypothetical protein ISS71_04525 [Phycisphaerae bacterium]|nr:hypothetical protein [Phycisphaerae bacterium]
MAAIFEAYLEAINKDYLTGDAREHTYRPALKTFVERLRDGIHVQNEPKHLITCAAPDMKVSRGNPTEHGGFREIYTIMVL